MPYSNHHHHHQNGNVLFLILIAVVLFAALSYSVTKSTSGSGNANKELSTLNAASITQYPTFIKQQMLRMQLNGIAPENISLAYNNISAPASQSDWNNVFGAYNADPESELFNPAGGSTTFQTPDPKFCANNACGRAPFVGQWRFHMGSNTTSGKKMLGVGTPNADTIAILYSLTLETCNAINQNLGLSTPPAQDSNGTETYEAYTGQTAFCMEVNTGDYWYIHTLSAF